MNFSDEFPLYKGKDKKFIVVGRLTKYAHLHVHQKDKYNKQIIHLI